MSAHNAGPYTLSIPNAGTDTPALSTLLSAGQLKVASGSCIGMTVTSPAALTGTITIQTVPTEGSSSWVTLQQNGSDITVAAGKMVPISVGAFRDIRIHSSGAEGSQRDFLLTFQLTVTRDRKSVV